MIAAMKMIDSKRIDHILAKLGIESSISPNIQGLQTIYSAWCQKVPFDNISKLIHLDAGAPSPLPGNDPFAFFENWLNHGTGGTCWAGSEALYTLLLNLGFQPARVIATMLTGKNLAPNHGSIIVSCEGRNMLVDTSLLHATPLQLSARNPTHIENPAWGVSASNTAGKYYISWRPLHMSQGCLCRVEETGAEKSAFEKYNEATRHWGPFNYSLYARINCGITVLGLSHGKKIVFTPTGDIEQTAIDVQERNQILTEKFMMSRTIISKIPADKPTPPPPWNQ